MSTTILNQKLQGIYQTYLEPLYSQEWDSTVSSPLLMHVFPEYAAVNKKILFVGQETHGWYQMSIKFTAAELQDKYEGFNLGKTADYRDGKPFRNLKSPFWNFSRSLFCKINGKEPDVTRKTNGFLWTNISKFDCKSTTPDIELQAKNVAGFHLLKAEIEILEPDMVVFLTGTKYDGWIDSVFNPIRVDILPDGFLKRLSVSDGSLPELTFQTKHPRTLVGSRKSGIPNKYHEVLAKLEEMALSGSKSLIQN